MLTHWCSSHLRALLIALWSRNSNTLSVAVKWAELLNLDMLKKGPWEEFKILRKYLSLNQLKEIEKVCVISLGFLLTLLSSRSVFSLSSFLSFSTFSSFVFSCWISSCKHTVTMLLDSKLKNKATPDLWPEFLLYWKQKNKDLQISLIDQRDFG